MPFFLYIETFAGSKQVPKNYSWGSWKVLDFLSVKEWEPCGSFMLRCQVCSILHWYQLEFTSTERAGCTLLKKRPELSASWYISNCGQIWWTIAMIWWDTNFSWLDEH